MPVDVVGKGNYHFPPHDPGHRSVKAQVCEMVGVIRRSLVHIAAIFCHSEGGWLTVMYPLVHVVTDIHTHTHTHTHTHIHKLSQ